MYNADDIVRLKTIYKKIQDIETIVLRHNGISNALADIEGQPAILMLIVAMSEQFDKLKKKNSNILDNFDTEDIKGLIGVRNYIAHDYDGVNLAIIETDIRENMPKLKMIIENIISK